MRSPSVRPPPPSARAPSAAPPAAPVSLSTPTATASFGEKVQAEAAKTPAVAYLQAENEKLQSSLEKLRSDLKKLQWEMIKVNTELGKRDAHIKELEGALGQREQLAGQLAAREARLTELQRASDEASLARLKLAAAENLIADLRVQCARLPVLERRLAELEATSSPRPVEPSPPPRMEPPALESSRPEPMRLDSLRKIHGIGRAFERALHEAGIRTFDQIAVWSPQDIKQIAKMLKVSPQRILRDGWVQKAQELARRRSKPTSDPATAASLEPANPEAVNEPQG